MGHPTEPVVMGIAQSSEFIFVVRSWSDKIIIDNVPPSRGRRVFPVPGLLQPRDIAACRKTGMLYVADMGRRIWRVDLSCKRVVPITTSGQPLKLSVSDDGRLLMTPKQESRLYVYDCDEVIGEKVIQLPDSIHPHHAIEIGQGSFVVAHSASPYPANRQRDQISVVDSAGHIVRSFGNDRGCGPGNLNIPCHLALDPMGRVLVCDYGNSRVLLLNSELQLLRYILRDMEVSL
jgi:DNA-binding beta-propeller fold protein YncE